MHVSPSRRDRLMRGFPWMQVLCALVSLGCVRTLMLGLPWIGGSSEAREAQVVDVIFRQGTWVLPLRNGIIPSKPPLFHWIGAGFAHLLGGISEFVVRLPSLLAGLVVLMCAAIIAFRFAKIRSRAVETGEQHARRAALLTVGLLSLTYEFHQMTVQAMVDMVFTAFVWCALAAICCSNVELWRSDRRISAPALAVFWLSCAGGILARGPVGAILPVALTMAGGVFLYGIRLTFMQLIRSWPWWMAFILPLGWFVAAYFVGGEAFVDRQLLFENVRRVTGGEFVNSEAWWFYLPSFLWQCFPWSICALVSLWRDITTLRAARGETDRFSARLAILPMVVVFFGIVMFSCASGKRHSYLLPIYPMVAIYVAGGFNALIEYGGIRARQRVSAILSVVQVSLIALSLAVLVVLGLIIQGSIWIQSHKVLQTLGGLEAWQLIRRACEGGSEIVVGLLLATCVPLLIGLRTIQGRAVGVWASAIVFVTAVSSLGAHVKAVFKGFPEITRRIFDHVGDSVELAVIKEPFDEYFDPILFYAHRPVTMIMTGFESRDCREEVLYLVRGAWINELSVEQRSRFSKVASFQEAMLEARGSSARELVLMRCRGGAVEHESSF